MKPRIRAYSLAHYRWHHEQAKFYIEYYHSWEYQFYIRMFNDSPWQTNKAP